jgi:Zn-dependent protease with chaperone function
MRLRQEYSPGSLLLYALTLTLETPVIALRLLVVPVVVQVALVASGHSTAIADGQSMALLVLAPTIWSLLALVYPGGSGWWWRQRTGGRAPSTREQHAYQDALELLQASAPGPLPGPGSWFVLDTHEPDAAVIGDTLMLARGLLESPHLPAVLAHEIGHIATSDGRITAALNRLVIHAPAYEKNSRERDERERRETHLEFDDGRLALAAAALYATVWFTRALIFLMRGGAGIYLLRPLWGLYWREREHTADHYAALLGQADELADFLEIHALIHDHPIPFIWLTDHTHPPTEHRIDQLRNHNQHAPSTTATGGASGALADGA